MLRQWIVEVMNLSLAISIHVLKELVIFPLFLMVIICTQVVWLLVFTLGVNIVVLSVESAMVRPVVPIEETWSIVGLIPVPFVGVLLICQVILVLVVDVFIILIPIVIVLLKVIILLVIEDIVSVVCIV